MKAESVSGDLGISALVRGVVADDASDGRVATSDIAGEARDASGLASDHASQPSLSLEVLGEAFRFASNIKLAQLPDCLSSLSGVVLCFDGGVKSVDIESSAIAAGVTVDSFDVGTLVSVMA